MAEDQNIEYKSKWQDEYLKWICGFANANGRIIFIGKDDGGKIFRFENAKELMEKILNKVRGILGIIVSELVERVKKTSRIRTARIKFKSTKNKGAVTLLREII